MDPVISRDDVCRVARLARLALSDDEVDRFTGQLADVLAYAGEVSALDAGDVAPAAPTMGLVNVLRDDVAGTCLDRDEVLGQAPAAEAGRFRVPPVLGGEA